MPLNHIRLFTILAIGFALVVHEPAYGQNAGASPAGNGSPPRIEQNPYERIQAFINAHGGLAGSIPADAHLRASAQRNALAGQTLAIQKSDVSAAATAATPTWVSIGPRPATFSGPPGTTYSGKVDAIVVDPANSNVVFIGTDSGGVWKSMDGGSNWIPLTDNTPMMGIGALAMDPRNSSVIYAGTGGDFGYYLEAGISKTTDGGVTWINVAAPFVAAGRPTFKQLAVDPSNSSIVLAATDYGVWRSTDAGLTWTLITAIGDSDDISFDRRQPGVAYYTWSYYGNPSAGLYKSLDSGATWTHIGTTGSNPLPAASFLHPKVVIDPSNSSTLYVQMVLTDFSEFSANGAIYKSTDGGAHWATISIPPLCCQTYMNLFAVNPLNPQVLYAGNVLLYRSSNGGATWSAIDNSTAGSQVTLHSDHHAIAFSGDGLVMYEGNDGGVYKTSSSAAAAYDWQNLNSTLATLLIYQGLSVDAGNLQNSFAGSQDNGTLHYQGAPSWAVDFSCGDGGSTAIDASNSSNVVIACANRPSVYRSSTGGAVGSFALASTGIASTDRVSLPPPLVADPSNPSRLYFGTELVYQSLDGAATWNAISPDLTLNNSSTAYITAMGVAPSDPKTLFVLTGDKHVKLTSNALSGTAAAWQDITGLINTPLPGGGNGLLWSVAVDPQSASTAYVGILGWNTRHLYSTTDRGNSWTSITGNLPDSPVNVITIDPDIPNTIYVGTDVGAYWTSNNGQTWQMLGQGLPNVIVNGLALHRASRTLRAATFGRSAWDLTLPPLPDPLAPSSTSLGFAAQVVGTGSATQTITMTNTRRQTANVSSIGLSGNFSATNTCGNPIPSGGNCTIAVTFLPTGADTRTGSITVNVNGVQELIALSGIGTITASLTATPATLTVGQPVTLTWASQSVATCTALGGGAGDGWAGSKTSSGSTTATESSASTFAYSLTCSAGSQSTTVQASVTETLPTVTLSANPTAITAGASVTLTWTSSNAAACTASGGGNGDGWAGNKSLNGTATATETAASAIVFTLTCTAAGQSAQSQVSVAVSAPPSSGGGGGTMQNAWFLLLMMVVFRTWALYRREFYMTSCEYQSGMSQHRS